MPGGTYPSRWSFLRFFAIDKLVTLSDDREVAKFSQNSYHCTFRNQSFKIKIINSRAARPTLKKWRNRSGHKSDTAAIISITFCNQYQPLSKAYLRLFSHKVMPAWTLAPWQSSLPQKELWGHGLGTMNSNSMAIYTARVLAIYLRHTRQTGWTV